MAGLDCHLRFATISHRVAAVGVDVSAPKMPSSWNAAYSTNQKIGKATVPIQDLAVVDLCGTTNFKQIGHFWYLVLGGRYL